MEIPMNVDCFQSGRRSGYGSVVPTGQDLSVLAGEAAMAVANQQPLTLVKTDVNIGAIADGELLGHLQAQIAAHGVGSMKVSVEVKVNDTFDD
jgi:hypothetical protein